jgi:hypothetical protein
VRGALSGGAGASAIAAGGLSPPFDDSSERAEPAA